jgi:anthranilate synthase component 1
LLLITFKTRLTFFCHSLEGKDNISEIEQLMQSRNILPINSKEGEGFQFNRCRIKHNVALAKKALFPWRRVSISFIKTFTQGLKETNLMYIAHYAA